MEPEKLKQCNVIIRVMNRNKFTVNSSDIKDYIHIIKNIQKKSFQKIL